MKSEVKLGRTFPAQELDAEFSPAPGPGWKADVTHRGTAEAFTLTTTSRDANTTQSAPPVHRNCIQKSSPSQHVLLALTNLEESDEDSAVEAQIDGERRNRRIRKVGRKFPLSGSASKSFSHVRTCWKSEDCRTSS